VFSKKMSILDFINNYIGALANILLVWEMLIKPFLKWFVMILLRKSMNLNSDCVALALSVENPQDRVSKLNNMMDYMRRRLPLPYRDLLDSIELENIEEEKLLKMSSFKIFPEEFYDLNKNLIEKKCRKLKNRFNNSEPSCQMQYIDFLFMENGKQH